jgi:nucleoside-diphosphate-sugar epimerase
MQNILVTGGAGYIGTRACKALAMAGLRPKQSDVHSIVELGVAMAQHHASVATAMEPAPF